MVQGQVFLKGGGAGTFPINFSRFIIFTFRNYFAKLCYAFEEKIIFFCHRKFMKKGYSKSSKNEPENIP